MNAPGNILKPEEVHPTHEVWDRGWYISDPICKKCGASVIDSPSLLKIPCQGKQLDLFYNE